jgi:hypothetical protein
MIVKYYANINKTNNHLSPQIIEHGKKLRDLTVEIQVQAQQCGGIKPVN